MLPAHAQRLVVAGEARVSYESYAGTVVPHWSGGFLLPMERNGLEAPVIHFIDETGREGQPWVFAIPNATSILVDDVAYGPDGRWAVSGRAHDRDGHGGGFISWLPANHQSAVTRQTYPYDALKIAIAPDGTTWTQGIEVVAGNEWVGSDHGIIRRFDRSGNPIGSYIPRNTLREEAITRGSDQGRFAVNRNRVGWYAAVAHEYFELSYDGNDVTGPMVYPGVASKGDDDTFITGIALMENGDVYVSADRYHPFLSGVYRLDRAARLWTPVSLPTKPDGTPILTQSMILGGDGTRFALFAGPRVIYVKPAD